MKLIIKHHQGVSKSMTCGCINNNNNNNINKNHNNIDIITITSKKNAKRTIMNNKT